MRILNITAMALALGIILATSAVADDMARWKSHAVSVEIVRDDWGIAHVHGKTDADAVFGAIYAQCEDDFRRVEENYLTALGLRAAAEGETQIWQDLRQRLVIEPDTLKADYAKSPDWLKRLMDSWADGMNFYLATHPNVKPRVITHYEPWMALSFTEGSIGGDIERASLPDLAQFYGRVKLGLARDNLHEDTGSNGIAIAPKDSADGHALLLINPHVTFFFRAELQMTSEEGLNAYGASTWGQFFIYQGFNPAIGWMHTTSYIDTTDKFAETVVAKDGKYFYRYGSELRPVDTKPITIAWRDNSGRMRSRTFAAYYTIHGPVVGAEGGKWISISLMNRPIEALEQSFLRTKAHDLASFMKVAALRANSSNDTVFADTKGEIAFLVPQFVPKRDDSFDYAKPVDGSDPHSSWQGPTPLDDLPHVLNPSTGWLFNTNDWPYSVAGPDSPKPQDFPRYLAGAGENMRGLHVSQLLATRHSLKLEDLERVAFDPFLPGFARLIPGLVKAYDATSAADPLRAGLQEQVALLRSWDYCWSDHSLATTLAVNWGDTLWTVAFPAGRSPNIAAFDALDRLSARDKLEALARVSNQLQKDFGTWRVAWGAFNRYQRVSDDIGELHFSDDEPSIPVPFVYSRWGSLASSAARRYPNTRRYYGASGNSFVAVVDFGPKIRAMAVITGGESGDPKSPHFNDQALRYVRGELRPVYFYPSDLAGHIERDYHPGD
ncbi:MAG TPA: penicillin acylase family protein [Rhizomicrobium sp.]|nr:penicillin acylase family protein [Rhizomicrobium sp.]